MNTQDKELRESWLYFVTYLKGVNPNFECWASEEVEGIKKSFHATYQVFFQKTPETPQVGQLWYVCVPGTDQVILRRLLAFSHERDKWLIGGIGNKLCEAIAPSWLFVRYRRFPRLRRLFNRLLGKS